MSGVDYIHTDYQGVSICNIEVEDYSMDVVLVKSYARRFPALRVKRKRDLFSALPTELLIDIFSRLGFITLSYSIPLVCSRFHAILESPGNLSRFIALERFRDVIAPSNCSGRTLLKGRRLIKVHRLFADNLLCIRTTGDGSYEFCVADEGEFFVPDFANEPLMIPPCAVVELKIVIPRACMRVRSIAEPSGRVTIGRVLEVIKYVLYTEAKFSKWWTVSPASSGRVPSVTPAFGKVELECGRGTYCAKTSDGFVLTVQVDESVPRFEDLDSEAPTFEEAF